MCTTLQSEEGSRPLSMKVETFETQRKSKYDKPLFLSHYSGLCCRLLSSSNLSAVGTASLRMFIDFAFIMHIV